MKKLQISRNVWPDLKRRLKDGLPKAAFYLTLFYVIWALFGPEYGFIASVTGTAFDFNFKKRLNALEMLLIAATQMIACSFACLASLNIVLRLTLNVLFPLVWTLLRSSPVDSIGYFPGVITFVFVQLIPFGRKDIPHLLLIAAFATAALTATLTVIKLFKSKKIDDSVLRDGLRMVASQLAAEKADIGALQDTEYMLYRRAYSGNNVMHIFARGEHIYYIFALIFQRAAYFFTDQRRSKIKEWTVTPRKELSEFLMRAAYEMNQQDNGSLIADARVLLAKGEDFPDRFGSLYRNILRLLILAMQEMPEGVSHKERFDLGRYIRDFKNHLKLNGFQFRFALRLSVVMTVCFAVMDISGAEHSYWMALNAFVITRPMYDESVTRVQSRLIGSIVGCVVTYLFYMIAPGEWYIYLYFSVMITCMYLCTPGKWVQPIFATSCGVAMASISLGGSAAVGYRLLYLGLAAALVYFVNRFIFPSTRQKRNEFYIHELYQMQKFYLDILKQSVRHRVSLTVLHNAIVNFHVLCDDLRKEGGGEYSEDVRNFLLCLWRLMAEAEQMAVILHTVKLNKEEKRWISDWLDEVSKKLDSREVFDPNEIMLHEMPDRPNFSYLAARYQQNLSAALRMASWTRLMPVLE
jgi:hypothetical protein